MCVSWVQQLQWMQIHVHTKEDARFQILEEKATLEASTTLSAVH